jgi:predicted transcriptional regulator
LIKGLHTGYLTRHQVAVWDMIHDGLSQSNIAKKLNVSQQAVSQVVESISQRMSTALNDAARLNNVEPRFMDINKGIMLGWNSCLRTEVVITLNPRIGLRIYYQHNLGECKICVKRRACKSRLLKNARELGVPLTQQERSLNPSELSSIVFSRVLGDQR